MKYCTNCGKEIIEHAKFCTNCGNEIVQISQEETPEVAKNLAANTSENSILKSSEIKKINQKITLKNSQTSIVKKSWLIAAFFGLLIMIAIADVDGFQLHPAIILLSVFLFLTALIVGFVFKSREKKLQSLITGENLIASWVLTSNEKAQYVSYLFKNEQTKNKGLFIITTVFIVVIFGLFIAFMDEGAAAMFVVMLAVIAIIALAAFGLPFYYKFKNSKNDGLVLLGKKYAYVNGYFHNWDFPLSGIKKVAVIHEPFYGVYLKYYYTDRTFTNSEELYIPASINNVNLQQVIDVIKDEN